MTRPRIGLVYELLGSGPGSASGPPDADAEYEPEATIAFLEEALRRAATDPVRLGGPHDLLRRLGSGEDLGVDAALDIAEGHGSRNREAWAPILLEMAEVPCLGSDALSLSTSLDKLWACGRVAMAGVPVVEQVSVERVSDLEKIHGTMTYPLFVKPRWEGTAKGIVRASRVEDRSALERAVERVWRLYAQPALVEPFLPGAEFTVSVVGHDPPRVLPALQRALERESGIGLHALDRPWQPPPPGGWEHRMPGELGPALEGELARHALAAFEALRCRDFARVDFRQDAEGQLRFLEINPLPSFAPDGSFGILAELAGREPADLVAEILAAGLRRLGIVC